MVPTDITGDRVHPRIVRRHRRAERERARALSPLRFLLRLLAIPGLALGVAASLYMRTSPYEPQLALMHLAARMGCDSAYRVGLAPADRGAPGYHARNDPDGDGVACDAPPVVAASRREGARRDAEPRNSVQRAAQTRFVGGAKFVRPERSD